MDEQNTSSSDVGQTVPDGAAPASGEADGASAVECGSVAGAPRGIRARLAALPQATANVRAAWPIYQALAKGMVRRAYARIRKEVALHPRRSALLALLVLVSVVAWGAYLIYDREPLPRWMVYGEGYQLVPDTLSQSGTLTIVAPEEAGAITPEQIRFEPELPGQFVASDATTTLYYRPKELPNIGAYHRVELTYGTTTIDGEFQVAEDPRILSILPGTDAETHEDTKVSVIFNRPMVPLTTRGELDQADIPVKLSPPTKGTWKWQSTRLLQFVPETTLTRATRYEVTVEKGFRSLDGVAVPNVRHAFTTRTLKVRGSSESVRFDEPFRITFNQPVDLTRTSREVTLTRAGERVEAVVTYATTEKARSGLKRFLPFTERTVSDSATLLVQPKADKHGRPGFWDFDTTYEVRIEKMYPTEGTEVLERAFVRAVDIPPVLASLSAASERSEHAAPDLFDPQGALVATFYEDVDKDATKLALTGVREVRYGEKCKTDADGNEIRKSGASTCEKEENKAELRIAVEPEAYAQGSSHTLRFERIVNTHGLVLTEEPFEREIRTVPALELTATNPNDGASNASLTSLTLCTKTPLARPEPGELRSVVKTDGYVVFPNEAWSNSFRVQARHPEEPCAKGDFHTNVRYGLHPNTPYHFTLSLKDDFGSSHEAQLSFTTASAPKEYTRLTSFHNAYNVTVPDKTRLTYVAENLPYVDVDICTVRPETMLSVLETNSLGGGTVPAAWCLARTSTRIDLPDTYWVNNYFYLELADHLAGTRGQHIVTLSHPSLIDENKKPRVERTLVSVSDLTVGEKRVNWWSQPERPRAAQLPSPAAENLYWVLQARTLEPAVGAYVTGYAATARDGEKKRVIPTQSALTDAEGIARIPATELGTGAIVRLGDDATLVSDYTDSLMYAWNQGGEGRTYLYTDRPIYRPGDSVQFKGIDRVGYDQAWRIVDGYEAPVKIYDSANKVVFEQALPVGRFGTFAGEFTLPADAPLGHYRIEAFENMGSFDVEEYAPAPFRLTVAPEREEYLAHETAAISIDARYYFDAPVSDAEVTYTVVSQDYYFDRYRDEYFSFGSLWYFCHSCGYGDEFVTRGTLVLDKNGKGSIALPLAFEKYFDKPEEKGSKLFTVVARVTDKNGRQVVGQQSIIVHRGAFYIGLRTDAYVGVVNEPLSLRAKTVDTEGKPVALRDIELTVSKVTWESYKRREVDGGFYYHSEEKKTELAKTSISTDRDGNGSYTHTFKDAGEYEFLVRKKDEHGNPVMTAERVYVAGPGSVSVRPTNNESLTLRLDKQSYKPGETATLLVESPFTEGRVLVSTERGAVYRIWTKKTTGSIITESIPILDTYAPQSYVSALLVGPGPTVKFGTAELSVGLDAYDLNIEVTPSKDAYLPGEEVELRVRTTNRGQPVAAEVSLAVVDMSVLALKGNPKKTPARFFYDTMSLGVTTAHSAKNVLIQHDIPTGTKGGGGDDGGLATRKRGIFRDTAYWAAQVETNAAGEATVRFQLPDNLTTWQVEALGVTLDTQLGVGYREFLSKKPVMAIPQRPRFILPGDTAWLGVQLVNNTASNVTLEARIASPSLTLTDAESKNVRVPAGESRIVYWETTAPTDIRSGSHSVTWSAEGDGYSDSVELTVPVARDITFETVATAGVSREKRVTESIYIPSYAGPEGELTITARPTLVTSLLAAVRDMALYPYGCSEQIASRIASLASLARAERLLGASAARDVAEALGKDKANLDEEIQKGIRDLQGRQTFEGGFAFYEGTLPNVPLTVEVLNALTLVREAGYPVADEVFQRGASYITNELTRYGYYQRDPDFIARTAFALASPYVPAAMRTVLEKQVNALARDDKALEELNTTALGYLANATLQAPYERGTADRFFGALENRTVVDARGAYIRERGAGADRGWFGGTEKNTAFFLRAVATRGGEHAVMDGLLRHLIASRSAEGGWRSTNSTAAVLDAALRLAEVRKEGEASYVLALLLNGTERATHTVNEATLGATFSHTIPLTDFARSKLEHVSLVRSDEGGIGSLYFDMALRYALPPDLAPPRDEGVTVERRLVRIGSDESVRTVAKGELVTGILDITIPEEYRAVSVESFIPAGFEIVNYRLSTESSRDIDAQAQRQQAQALGGMMPPPPPPPDGSSAVAPSATYGYETEYDPGHEPTAGPTPYPVTHEEMHDDRVFLFTEEISPGTYRYEYTLRALIPGTYRHMPATVKEMYRPEIFGRTSGEMVTITEE